MVEMMEEARGVHGDAPGRPVPARTVAGNANQAEDGAIAGDADIAAVAAVLADPTRAAIVLALSDGRALPAGELARMARVAPSTVSGHLGRLLESGLVAVEAWGRHRYYRIAGPDVMRALEALALLAPETPVRSLRQAQVGEAVRYARTCYDHLAGYAGVALTEGLALAGSVVAAEEGYTLTPGGVARLEEFGLDLRRLKRQGLFVPRHVDWSERRHHIAGPLAVALTRRLFELRWIERLPSSRAVRVTDAGHQGLRDRFSVDLEGSGYSQHK